MTCIMSNAGRLQRGKELRLWGMDLGFPDWDTFELWNEKQQFDQEIRMDRIVLVRMGEVM